MNLKFPKTTVQLNAHFPWVLMMVLLLMQSSLASDVLKINIFQGMDKIIHFFIFGVLGWLLTRGLVIGGHALIRMNFLWIVPVIGGLFAFFDELLQSTVPGRSADVYDWLADFCGIVVFMLLYRKKFNLKKEIMFNH